MIKQIIGPIELRGMKLTENGKYCPLLKMKINRKID